MYFMGDKKRKKELRKLTIFGDFLKYSTINLKSIMQTNRVTVDFDKLHNTNL